MKNNMSDFDTCIPHGEAAYDVIVCGSGMAGLSAAVSAGRQGARVLLLEGQGVLGGTTHCCLWMPVAAWDYRDRDPTIRGEDPRRTGFYRLFEEKIRSLGLDAAALVSVPSSAEIPLPPMLAVHPDYLRVAAFELLEEAGCHYRLYSPVTGVLKEEGRLHAVVVTGKEGPQVFRARAVVDATGDGDVAWLAGAEFSKGRVGDGALMPMTLTFVLGNVDLPRLLAFKPGKHEAAKDWTKATPEQIEQRYRENPGSNTAEDQPFHAVLAEARAEGYTTAMWYAFTATSLPAVVSVNNGGLWQARNLDGTRSADLTLAERAGARIAVDFVRIARRWEIPGLAHCHLLRVGSVVAVRETRCIAGDRVIEVEDVVAGRVPEDSVARAYEYFMDTVRFHAPAKGLIGIPYGALLPKGIEGLLVAGRCISARHESLGGFRGMGSVMHIGQAAGVAAALAVRRGVTPRQVGADEIRTVLRTLGVSL